MCDLEDQIEKCTVCAHVMHKICITSWWNLSSRWNSIKGKCPYCKDPRGFSHIRQDSEDPWHNFDFSNGSEAADQQVPELLLPAAEEAADQPVPELLLPAAEEAADQQVPELLLPAAEEQHDQGINLIRRMNQVLSFINSFGNLNMNDPRIQYLESRLESLQQEHNAIQNAFQAQPQ
jgi:hypothetical protein